jgi:hypothetical protein
MTTAETGATNQTAAARPITLAVGLPTGVFRPATFVTVMTTAETGATRPTVVARPITRYVVAATRRPTATRVFRLAISATVTTTAAMGATKETVQDDAFWNDVKLNSACKTLGKHYRNTS